MTNQRRKEEIRAKIVDAATRVFLQKGYAETKMIDIAREAHISPSTIYLYFENKKNLFSQLDIPEAAEIRPEYDRRREKVMEAALEVFGEYGFEGATMDDIASRIGFSKAALYQYCSSKDDLFCQVLQTYTHANAPSEAATGVDYNDWQQSVRNIARSFMAVNQNRDRTAFLGSLIRDTNKFPEFGAMYYEQSFALSRSNTLRFLTAMQERGEIRADVDLWNSVTVFFAALMSHTVLYKVVQGIQCDAPEDDYTEALCEMFIRGLEKRPEDA